MSDLVLNRLVEKLSSPEFILVTVVNTIVTKLIDLINGKNRVVTQTRTGWSAKLKQFLNSSYHKISDFIVNISYGTKNIIQGSPEEEDIPFDVFDNSLVKLINTITNFSERKPLVTNFLTFIRSALKLNEKLNMKVNSICSRYIANKIKTSLTEDFISGVISDLRIKLFYPENNSDNEEVTPTVNHITDKFIDLYQDRLPQLLGGYVGSNLLKYDKESDQEQRESIKRMLIIFNSVDIKDEIGQPATRMNKLLIMKVLDCIVANLYPELL
ncbi:uncharacterized protein SPAPADRAFT_58086 [Spathaspora passalidarum NRRL Y-27907]|uniref:Uncharacterized protein n=1 Tax=Spathaspora passalidarum (strain NRRL Y-27907 / 11-Y1) TaxID=619300 RepID=G3AFH3_SPAPN|nr:uncharacterized protein SPAPADRAFT_58086 [Spathaspora passalidarum NRRL Y-27907]EGW34962.1 hypothetical protein SPAPADRAFT_58086 [Spathaspora passalidarum NRRL Y-27907]